MSNEDAVLIVHKYPTKFRKLKLAEGTEYEIDISIPLDNLGYIRNSGESLLVALAIEVENLKKQIKQLKGE